MNRKLLLVVAPSVLVLVVVATLILGYLGQTVITITTEPDATILVTQNQGGEFNEIGTGQAKYRTNLRDTLYIEVIRGDELTQTSIEVGDEDENITVPINGLSPAKSISRAKLSYVYQEGDSILGVNPDTQSISFDREGANPGVNYLGVPFLRKIDWVNKNRFIGVGFGAYGVGTFKNGEYTQLLTGSAGSLVSYSDYALSGNNQSLLLLNNEGFYRGNKGLDTFEVELIRSISNSKGGFKLLAGEDRAYLIEIQFAPSREEEEFEEGLSQANPVGAVIEVYGYDGSQIESISYKTDSETTKIVHLGGTEYGVLTDESFIYVVDGKASETEFYVTGTRDVVYLNDRLFVFNTGGLWEVDGQFQYLVYKLPDGLEYAPESLDIAGPDKLLFTTQLATSEITNTNRGADDTDSINVLDI